VAVDEVMARFGFVPPPWYEQLKQELEPLVEDTESLASLVRSAGYREIDVIVRTVDTGLATPAEVVDWRLGMAQLAQFVAGLPPDRRDQAHRAAEAAVVGQLPVLVDVQLLAAT
jgi:hypothetical protein